MKSGALVPAIWVACLAAFVALALHASTRNDFTDDRLSPPVDSIDIDIARAVQDLPSALDDAFAVPNRYGAGMPLTLITGVAAVAFSLRIGPIEAALLVISLVSRTATDLAKRIVEAPRPTFDLVEVRRAYADYSYPSGHVVGTTVVFVLLFVFADKLRLPAPAALALRAISVFMVGSVGLARVWEGAHWPSDVLGGYLFAAAWLIPMLWLRSKLKRRADVIDSST